MRTSHAWIQPYLLYGIRICPHRVVLRHILNTVTSFLFYSANDIVCLLLPNDLIFIWYQRVD
jgi:hypothetical protein